MSHRTAKHEKAYRKGKSALKSGTAAKTAAASACTDFLDGVYKTVKEAAKIYEVDVMAVHRRLWYVPFLLEIPDHKPELQNFLRPLLAPVPSPSGYPCCFVTRKSFS